jgi:demethylmenaquinone methyltransferase/2-methoxy-6-polyprenyl-1,4-benzoquinol methylase
MEEFNGKQKESFVREMFDDIARKYDRMNTLMTFGLDRRWRRFVAERVGASPGMQLLDVCCGTGQLSFALARAVGPKGRVTGLDFSEKMLDIARGRLSDMEGPMPVVFVQGNAMSLPFEDNLFDGVTVGWGLRNVPDLTVALREMVRVVRPGGKVVSLDMAKPSLPVFKQLYWLYFETIIPLMGKIWAGKRSAYQYLYESARTFPSQQELAALFSRLGLRETAFHNLAGGVVAVVEGRKPWNEAGECP